MAAYHPYVLQKLHSIVQAKGLQSFYSHAAIQQETNEICNTIDLESLRVRWNLPWEMVVDLCSLALYDIIIYADDSGSMTNDTRIQDLKDIIAIVAEAATLFDTDGISVRFMNADKDGDLIRNASDVTALLAGIEFLYCTPLATEMKNKILDPMVLQRAKTRILEKPVLIITITDREPYPELDDDSEIGGYIDCTSHFELEQEEYMKSKGVYLTREMWLVKLMVGAVDPSYDEQD
ncbi:hypothetical protein HDV00_007961 [Rhizophlyctis rosea]|nr:hypothetical protein HDV00_007961 [Rhizophlyctis rosea]